MMDVDERTGRRGWERARLVLSRWIVQLKNAEIAVE